MVRRRFVLAKQRSCKTASNTTGYHIVEFGHIKRLSINVRKLRPLRGELYFVYTNTDINGFVLYAVHDGNSSGAFHELRK